MGPRPSAFFAAFAGFFRPRSGSNSWEARITPPPSPAADADEGARKHKPSKQRAAAAHMSRRAWMANAFRFLLNLFWERELRDKLSTPELFEQVNISSAVPLARDQTLVL